MALPLIVGISGASGAVYGVRLQQALRNAKIPSHLIVSKSAAPTLKEETDLTVNQVCELADVIYANGDVGAAMSSVSIKTRGMMIIPCSIRTVSDIAYGTTDSLLSRAADFVLKERRRLVLMCGKRRRMPGICEVCWRRPKIAPASCRWWVTAATAIEVRVDCGRNQQ